MKYLYFFQFFILFSTFSQTVVLTEDFQSGIPNTWAIVKNDTNTPHASVSEYTNAWILKEDPDNLGNNVTSSTSYFLSPSTSDHWLISPAITLDAFGNYIQWKAKSHDPSFPENYKVLISTTSNSISSFLDTIQLVYQEEANWVNHEVDLSSLGYINQTVYIAFVHNTYDGFKLYIDDVEVRKNDPLQLYDINKKDISIYPNPSSEILYIDTETSIDQLTIVNQLGEKVFETNKSISTLNLEFLDSGLYTLMILSQDEIIFTERLIIKH